MRNKQAAQAVATLAPVQATGQVLDANGLYQAALGVLNVRATKGNWDERTTGGASKYLWNLFSSEGTIGAADMPPPSVIGTVNAIVARAIRGRDDLRIPAVVSLGVAEVLKQSAQSRQRAQTQKAAAAA